MRCKVVHSTWQLASIHEYRGNIKLIGSSNSVFLFRKIVAFCPSNMWPPYIITYKTVMLNHKNIRKNSQADIYLFKVHIRNFSERCVICSKLTIKTAGRRQWRWRCSGVLIVNFEHISQLFQLFFGVFLLRMITNHRLISSFFKRNIYRFFHLCLRIYNDINSCKHINFCQVHPTW